MRMLSNFNFMEWFAFINLFRKIKHFKFFIMSEMKQNDFTSSAFAEIAL